MLKTTEQHKKYWQDRKIDWKTHYYDSWNHPHRELIVEALKQFPWFTLWEVGVGGGANIARIVRDLPGRHLGGSDVSEDAVAFCREAFKDGKFQVESVEDMLMSDHSSDVILSDATLIYVDPKKIDKVMGEIVRIARNNIVLCEFHSKSWWKRFWFRMKSGYNAYDYDALLKRHGCYDVRIFKIPKRFWPGTPWEEWGHIIIASVTH